VDGDVRRDRRIALGQFFENQYRVTAAESGTAELLLYIDAAHPQGTGLPEHVHGKVLAFVPLGCVGRQGFAGEVPYHLDHRLLVLIKFKHLSPF
jgi:hypothetical protein